MHLRRTILIATILALGAFSLYMGVAARADIKNLDSKGTTIVAFGDSLVRGVGASEGMNFVSRLVRSLGTPISNLGRSGDTTESALGRINLVLAENPRLVIILLGGNDFLFKVPRETTFKNLGDIVNKIQEHGAAVLLLGVRGGFITDTYENDFEKFAAAHHVAYVPNVLDGIIGHNQYMSDMTHPNDAGYALIAKKVEPVLKKMLGVH